MWWCLDNLLRCWKPQRCEAERGKEQTREFDYVNIEYYETKLPVCPLHLASSHNLPLLHFILGKLFLQKLQRKHICLVAINFIVLWVARIRKSVVRIEAVNLYFFIGGFR